MATMRQCASVPRGRYLALLTIATCLIFFAMVGCTPPKKPSGSAKFYPALPARPRIQFLRTLASSDDVDAPRSSLAGFVLGKDKSDVAQGIVRPYGVAMSKGKLYVADSGAARVVFFDFKNRKFGMLGAGGTHAMKMPISVTVAPNGEKYVCDTKRGEILVFDKNEQPSRTITRPEGMKPSDAAWHKGELFVADLKRNAVLVLDPATGSQLRQIGKKGAGPGEFSWPTNLTFGPDGDLYVTGTFNARVQRFDSAGKLVRVYGGSGLSLGKMVRPKGIAVDRANRLYVVDAATESVQIFSDDGPLLLMLGAPGDGPGDMLLPTKVAVSYDDVDLFAKDASPDFKVEHLIFVTNQFGVRKINVYGFGRYTGVVPNETPAGRAAMAKRDKARAKARARAIAEAKAKADAAKGKIPTSAPADLGTKDKPPTTTRPTTKPVDTKPKE